LSAEELEERLEEHVDAVLSSRRTAAGPARQLAAFDAGQQQFVLHWVRAMAATHAEMGFQFAAHAYRALRHMDMEAVEAWAIQAMDAYDRQGLRSGIAALQQAEAYARERAERVSGLPLEDVAGILERFIHGLNGRMLRLEAGAQTYTDTETLYLPALLGRLSTRGASFRLYKATMVHLWAQTWYGTWRLDIQGLLGEVAQPARVLRRFHALETLRLDACIARDFPGLHRDMVALRQELDEPAPTQWLKANARLQMREATAQDSWTQALRLGDGPSPPECCYQGVLLPQAVGEVMSARRQRDREALRVGLATLRDELHGIKEDVPGEAAPEREPAPFRLRRVESDGLPDGFRYELQLGERPVDPPADVRGVMASILQDLGEIPPDYLTAAGPGAYTPQSPPAQADPDEVWKGTYHEQGALLYNEWDHARRHYRKDWCVLRERDVHPQHNDFVARTLRKHRDLLGSLRRSFEALRSEDRLLKKQPYGEDVDIDALVEAYADMRSGMEMGERLFTKRHKLERDIAVMFMVDMSGSTKGWINEAEREALVLLCEVLETLGDRYAIYGFSGMTRKRCELFRIKRFEEPYNEEVRARISGILPQDYTRMGVAIRHLSRLLQGIEARTKLLVTLSDGKPDDYTGYRGEYGIEDTRQALFEARREGIHPFCITIDEQAGEYLPHMYGAVSYVVIDAIRRLPLKVADIYRRLTT
jgi:nitric oxide reductase NorD protein